MHRGTPHGQLLPLVRETVLQPVYALGEALLKVVHRLRDAVLQEVGDWVKDGECSETGDSMLREADAAAATALAA